MSHLSSYLVVSRKSQAALAEEVGVSRGYMSELVAGAKKPGLDLAFAIERATEGAVPAISWVDVPAQANPDTLGAGDADEAGEQIAVGGEGAGHGAQDACAAPGVQENTVSGAFNQRVAHV